jgi:hypothetical protein
MTSDKPSKEKPVQPVEKLKIVPFNDSVQLRYQVHLQLVSTKNKTDAQSHRKIVSSHKTPTALSPTSVQGKPPAKQGTKPKSKEINKYKEAIQIYKSSVVQLPKVNGHSGGKT